MPDDASRKVVHHALTFTVAPDAAETQSGGDDSVSDGGQFLVEYASGKNAEIYPEDSGLLVQAGKKMKLDYHLHSIGEQVDAQVRSRHQVFTPRDTCRSTSAGPSSWPSTTSDLDIPGGEIVRSDGYTRFNRPARITAFQPHMHIRGKYQCLELIYPTSSTPIVTEIVSCAHFNYNWHLVYNYADDVAPIVPAGTILHVISLARQHAGQQVQP